MKTELSLLFVVLVLISGTHSLFTTAPVSNFTISGLNVTNAKTVVDGTGTKVLFWSPYPSQLQMYNTNGTHLCSLNSTNSFTKIIWPANSGPLVSYIFGSIVDTLDETTCTKTKSYNLGQIINVPLEAYLLDKYTLIGDQPILTVTGRFAVYEVNLATEKLLNTYKVNDQTATLHIQSACYSGDFSYLYVVATTNSLTSMSVKIYDTKKQNQGPLKEVKMPDYTTIASVYPARDNSSILLYGLSAADLSTSIFSVDNAGNLFTKITRFSWVPGTLITDTNLFDSVVFFNLDFLSVELVRISDGKSMQTFPFPDMENVKDAEYSKKTIAVLMNNSQVLTFSYQDDHPDANPDDEGSSSTVWIIVGVILGVIIIGVAVVFILKKKQLLMFKKKEENYGKITDQV